MKKLLTATTLFSILTASAALAKTEGNYVGIDLISTNLEASGRNPVEIKEDDQISFGVNYKYALNFNNFYLAPGVFFDYSNLSLKDEDEDDWNLNYRYGVKLDAGYDVMDKLAFFANVALVNNAYEVDWKSVNQKKSDNDLSVAYGFGLKYSALENLDVSLGYEISEFSAEVPNGSGEQSFDVSVAKVGLAYKF